MTPEEREELRMLKALVFQLIKSDRLSVGTTVQMLDGRNFQLGKTNGTKFGTAASQKLAFFGETPIIQQSATSQTAASFSANTSGITNDSATWGGYTVGDIVAILQAFGFIE